MFSIKSVYFLLYKSSAVLFSSQSGMPMFLTRFAAKTDQKSFHVYATDAAVIPCERLLPFAMPEYDFARIAQRDRVVGLVLTILIFAPSAPIAAIQQKRE